MPNKRLVTYFALTLFVFATCMQVATEASSSSSSTNSVQAQINDVQVNITQLQNMFNSLVAPSIGPIGPAGSTIQVKTGIVKNSDTINYIPGYTKEQCWLILGLPSENATPYGSFTKGDTGFIVTLSPTGKNVNYLMIGVK
jgi:hypothetical protein